LHGLLSGALAMLLHDNMVMFPFSVLEILMVLIGIPVALDTL
jgi:hypothetical protein